MLKGNSRCTPGTAAHYSGKTMQAGHSCSITTIVAPSRGLIPSCASAHSLTLIYGVLLHAPRAWARQRGLVAVHGARVKLQHRPTLPCVCGPTRLSAAAFTRLGRPLEHGDGYEQPQPCSRSVAASRHRRSTLQGLDKYENEDLIKHSLPHDVWFHVDALSSAHVYLRLPQGAGCVVQACLAAQCSAGLRCVPPLLQARRWQTSPKTPLKTHASWSKPTASR